MNAKLNLAPPSSILTVAAATVATVITIGILWGVVVLFQSQGAPMERLAAAERACAHHAYLSEREACAKQWLAESQGTTVVSR